MTVEEQIYRVVTSAVGCNCYVCTQLYCYIENRESRTREYFNTTNAVIITGDVVLH